MKIDISEHKNIRLQEVFNPIELRLPNGRSVYVQMRDGELEIGVQDTSVKMRDGKRGFVWYRTDTQNGGFEPQAGEGS
jgi:hypothetical protein